MNWFKGTINEAAELCKKNGKGLLVAILAGISSAEVESQIKSSEVGAGVSSDCYVCYLLQEDSPDYLKFWSMFPDAVEVKTVDGNSCIYIASSQRDGLSLKEQLAEARKSAALKHQQKLKLDAEEKLRRKQNPTQVEKRSWQSWQDLDECKNHAEEVKKKKLQDEEHRRHVRSWISDDRAKKNLTSGPSTMLPSRSQEALPQPPREVGTVQIKFHFSNGYHVWTSFREENSLEQVRQHVQESYDLKEGLFELVMGSRRFSADEYEESLKDLGLSPSATLMVLEF